jgi:hypothetical protein
MISWPSNGPLLTLLVITIEKKELLIKAKRLKRSKDEGAANPTMLAPQHLQPKYPTLTKYY